MLSGRLACERGQSIVAGLCCVVVWSLLAILALFLLMTGLKLHYMTSFRILFCSNAP